ncbi:DNA topoisomerase 2 [Tulasnella sp. JGI-2019a]|nr:DNA topoisomerase 2 [Tulasnella sp. JGI-2019a]KAG9028542.1 DNA topoisomerase 2 [Tulasnella sp. JGI-2019a]
MSDSESENFDLNMIEDSDGEESDFAPPSKKAKDAPAKAPAAKAPKKATAPKVATTSKPKVAPKKKVATATESDDDVESFSMNGGEDFGGGAKNRATMSEDDGSQPKKKKSVSDKYQKLSQIEHILQRPDSYIGSIEFVTEKLWVFDSETKRMAHREIQYVPGFLKIVDEILVNAADNKINDPNMDTLKVTIDVDTNYISVWNNGKGIPIEIHSKEKIYIPEMIFGHLLTGSNYNDEEKKLTGGRNGYGAKLTNIYSTEFTVETCDKDTGQKYKQTFKKNMGEKGVAKITSTTKGEEYTQISFKPDLPRFGMQSMDPDTVALLKKRVYDMAGTVKGVKVVLNGERLKVKDFKTYCEMYLKSASEEAADNAGGAAVEKKTLMFEEISNRWEVGFSLSDSGNFQQVSFANSIATIKGGTHVKCIQDQFTKAILAVIEKKNKGAKVKPAQIANHMWLFVRCLIENPTFDSQTKETLTLQQSKFGGKKPVLSEEFLKKVVKSPIVDNILNWARFKAGAELGKTDGKKRARMTGLTKLSDANNAGGRNASKCTLILTEGDSAKALAEAGLSVVGRDNFGVFPLKGKLLNVREASHDTIMKNQEISNIKKIMGLQTNMNYKDTTGLRYGSLMIMADQDHDGSHIKGLLINFIDHFFPSLLKLPSFLVEFVTPIVRAKRGKQTKDFFTLPEFETWNEANNQDGKWSVKYFKGLGTSDDDDAMEYFSNTAKHVIPFAPVDAPDRDLIDMAFSKKRIEDRKEWLRNFKPGTFIDHDVEEIPIKNFINEELICFSMADNMRSIPSAVDGLKPGQRKIMFGCYKLKMKKELKVAQLIGYISAGTAYHHGEQSLADTIVGMAQTFVGSNNINLLSPNGQFGTRATGGSDHASPRYIFTLPTALSRAVFHPQDDALLKYLEDDGQSIEPEWFMPVIPMVLVNGCDGIGTGYSTKIPNYNPHDIVANIRRMLRNEPMVPMIPWYRGFKGSIEKTAEGKFLMKGIIKKVDREAIEITELPVGVWTQSYKEQLEKWVTGVDNHPAIIKDYKEHHTNSTVHFTLTMTPEGMAKAEADPEGLLKFFQCQKPLSTSNMMAFDSNLKLRKYTSPEEIIEDFFPLRLQYYQKRKDFLCDELRNVWDKLTNQARFVQMIVDKKLVVSRKKKADLVAELHDLQFKPIAKPSKAKAAKGNEPAMMAAAGDDDEEEEGTRNVANVFDYLLSMPIWSLTEEKVVKLLRERDAKEEELNVLLMVKPSDIWERELDQLLDEFEKILEGDSVTVQKAMKGRKAAQTLKTRKSLTGAKGKKKAVASDDSEEDFKLAQKAARAKVKAPKPAAAPRVKAAAAKAMLDDEDEDEDEKPPRKPAPKPAPPGSDSDAVMEVATNGKGKAKGTLKRKSPSLSDVDDDDAEPPKAAKKAKPLQGKQSALADFFDGGGKSKPGGAAKAPIARKPSATKKKATSDDEDKPVAVRKVSAAKAKKAISDDDGDDAPVVKKKPPPKKKPALPSDGEDIEEIEEPAPAPQRNGPRRAAATVKKTYTYAMSSSATEGQDTDAFDMEDDD